MCIKYWPENISLNTIAQFQPSKLPTSMEIKKKDQGKMVAYIKREGRLFVVNSNEDFSNHQFLCVDFENEFCSKCFVDASLKNYY